MSQTNPAAFKHLFNQELLKRMAKALQKVYPPFDSQGFKALMPSLEALEMKARVRLIRDELKKRLPEEYAKAVAILFQSIKEGSLSGFDLWPYSDFIQTYGLNEPELSLQYLRELTPLFTSEFAVRPYLRLYPSETLAYLKDCAEDSNVHVRRWASEGTRPRLPWGERLQSFIQDPAQSLPILERLKFDPELYVRKSVSNHLNDIAKDHPAFVIQLLRRWKSQAKGSSEQSAKLDWIIKRSLRSLIKSGHPEALALLGVDVDAKVRLAKFTINKRSFQMGEQIEFSFNLQSLAQSPQKLVVDYIMHFMRANGKTAPKVFKLKNLLLPAGAKIAIAKVHQLKEVTTRTYYPGRQFLEIQINGLVHHRTSWKLEPWKRI